MNNLYYYKDYREVSGSTGPSIRNQEIITQKYKIIKLTVQENTNFSTIDDIHCMMMYTADVEVF